jgi:Flp pilus assembly protein TadG
VVEERLALSQGRQRTDYAIWSNRVGLNSTIIIVVGVAVKGRKIIWLQGVRPNWPWRDVPSVPDEIGHLSIAGKRLILKEPIFAVISFATIKALKRLANDSQANVAMIFGLLLPATIFATGLAVDYTAAARKKVALDAAADAAALSAVTPAMLQQSDKAAVTTAQNMFNGQVAGISALDYNTGNLSVDSSTDATTGIRTVTVNYTASSQNAFANIFALFAGPGSNTSTWPIAGTSTATARPAPNIDFYLLLDNSPSMNIAATTVGINTMVANTSAQGGCAFACHETNPAGDGLGNPGGIDNYQLAQNLGVVTRMENLRTAVQQLTSFAQATETNTNASYRMGIYTFNYTGATQVSPLTSNLSSAATLAGNIDVMLMYQNNCRTQNICDNDVETNFETAAQGINNTMPAPGTGYSGSTPQEVLFLVSDGVDDIPVTGGQPSGQQVGQYCCGNTRFMGMFNTSWCTTVKNRGIRIAVLYTQYLPLPTNGWYNTYVAPFEGQIAANMQSCASAGLFSQITTDGDITQAIESLFAQAVQTATLLK